MVVCAAIWLTLADKCLNCSRTMLASFKRWGNMPLRSFACVCACDPCASDELSRACAPDANALAAAKTGARDSCSRSAISRTSSIVSLMFISRALRCCNSLLMSYNITINNSSTIQLVDNVDIRESREKCSGRMLLPGVDRWFYLPSSQGTRNGSWWLFAEVQAWI